MESLSRFRFLTLNEEREKMLNDGQTPLVKMLLTGEIFSMILLFFAWLVYYAVKKLTIYQKLFGLGRS